MMRKTLVMSDTARKAYTECKGAYCHWNFDTWVRYFRIFDINSQRLGDFLHEYRKSCKLDKTPLTTEEQKLYLTSFIQLNSTLILDSHSKDFDSISDVYALGSVEFGDKKPYIDKIELICNDYPIAKIHAAALLDVIRTMTDLPLKRKLFGKKLEMHEAGFIDITQVYEQVVKLTAPLKDPF